MNCYECALVRHSRTAVAVCRVCGVAVCADHAQTATADLRRPAGTGEIVRDLAARKIMCPVCRTADESP
ncbi:DUF2180 family protein [Streptomyces alboflavus]|uniref:DUF2180 family protein n=1 Tax=Streptomyces alboflavus TaxID=67267 RepID=UPI0004C06E5F|nr:DUF2180 family protein [Streptomyces alboflavus]